MACEFPKFRSILKSALLMTAALLLVPQSGRADQVENGESRADLTEMSMEELMNTTVYGASKFLQKTTEAPSSVSIVTSEDIKKYGYRTLADIIRSVRGFYVSYDRNYSYIGVRGFNRPGDYNTRILLLVDGHRINDNVYDQAMTGTEFILDVDLIDRIELIRGSGSSLYGSNAFFAIVSIISKRGRDLKGAEISGEGGSFRTNKGRVSYGDQYKNGLEAIMSGSGYDSKGDRLYFQEFNPAYSTDPRATNGGIADHTDYDRYQSFLTKLSHQDITLEGAYSSRTKGIPTGSFLTDFNEPGNKTIDTRSYVDLNYEHNLGKQTDITVKVFYDYYQYTGDYLSSIIFGAPNKDWAYGEWWGSDIKFTSRAFDVHRIILGVEYVDNLHQDQKNYDVVPYTVYLDDRRRSRNWASYVQDEATLARNLIVNAGVRYDHFSTFGGTANPRLALIYNPREKSSIKLLYGSAFRAPNDYEMFYASLTQAQNLDLKPEKIKMYELVYEQYAGDHFRMTAAGYYYKITDLIGSTETVPGSGIMVFRNINEVDARGFGLELENKWANGLDGRINYTIQRTEDKFTGEPLTNSPEHLAKFNLTVPIMSEKIFAGIEEQYTSRRRTLAGNYAQGFFISNLTLFSRNMVSRLEASASVYNLFDKKYVDPGSEAPNPPYAVLDTIQQDARSYRVKLTYRF
jgi:iron complex outermembrane receptor protein